MHTDSSGQPRPLLSILIPTYNRAHYLRLSLYNWLDQINTAKEPVELIVSDNASTDNTREVVEEAHCLGSFKYNRNSVNLGFEKNAQKLLNIARGEFVWILGDDDIPLQGAVDRVLDVIKDKSIPTDYIFVNYRWGNLDASKLIKSNEIDWVEKKVAVDDFEDKYMVSSEIVPILGLLPCAIRSNVWRREKAIKAFSVDFNKTDKMTFFATQMSFFMRNALHEFCYYIGRPCTYGGIEVAWGKYMPLYNLEVVPSVFDLFEEKGVDPESIKKCRRAHFYLIQSLIVPWFFRKYPGQTKSFRWIICNRLWKLFRWSVFWFFIKALMLSADRQIGKAGLLLKKHNPKIYNQIKRKK